MMSAPVDPPPTLTRRRLLRLLGNLSLLGSLIAVVRGAFRFLVPPVRYTRARILLVGRPADFAPGTLTFFPAGPVFVGSDEQGLYAMSATCTHLGCTVGKKGAVLACPCHGSRFSSTGDLLGGPAPRPLPHLALTLAEEDQLHVHLSRPVSPESRLAWPSTQS
jgi:cytochrome b6-f complex iron-sulfur subunit